MGLSGRNKGSADGLKSQMQRPQSGNRRKPLRRRRKEKTEGDDGEGDEGDEWEEEEEPLRVLLRECSRAAVLARWSFSWSMVQNACYCVWNGIWAAWASPTDFIPTRQGVTSRANSGSMLYEWRPLLECAHSLLDMIEIIQREVGVEVFGSRAGDEDETGDAAWGRES